MDGIALFIRLAGFKVARLPTDSTMGVIQSCAFALHQVVQFVNEIVESVRVFLFRYVVA